MKKGYTKLIAEVHENIKGIRQNAQRQIAEVQNYALTQAERDFTMLGWNKYWTKEQLTADGQFERLEQSVLDTKLKLISVDQKFKKGIVDGCTGSYEVSGAKCNCADFVYRGLPCKHMYFLSGILVSLYNDNTK